MKQDKILAIVAAILLFLVLGMIGELKKQKAEIGRQKNNVAALTYESRTYRDDAGRNATEVRDLRLLNNELEAFNADLEQKVKDAGIKIKNLQAAKVVAGETKIVERVKTVTDTVYDTRRARFFDGWNDINVISRKDSTFIDVSSRDTINVITHIKQKKFLFFRVGKPKALTTVTNGNPKTKLEIEFSASFE